MKGARTELVDLEELSDVELERFQHEFQQLREHYHVMAEHVSRESGRRKKHRRAQDRAK